ncbi:MAG: DUF58 domain-containing protein [Actinomycetota bacterium]
MPTARGWGVLAAGGSLWTTGRLFGSPPLEHIGFALVVLIVLAVGAVRLGKHDLHITRRISPDRARVDQAVTVTLEMTNSGRGPAPLVLLEDRVPYDLSGTARFALHGIESHGHRTAAFELTPGRRGRFQIGPLQSSFIDPFGLARVRSVTVPPASLLVHPRIETLTMARDPIRQRSHAPATLRQLTGARGEDFYTLREYAEGDDLRKIHWASTAKRHKPMIRQEETPWHTRATIVLDDRPWVHDSSVESSFERAVQAAASLVDLYHRSGYSFRLTGAQNPGWPSSKGEAHLRRCLDLLAEVALPDSQRDASDPLATRLAELERGSGGEGSLWLVTGSLTPEAAFSLTRCASRFMQITAIAWPAHRFGVTATRNRWQGEEQTREAMRMLGRSGIRALVLGPGDAIGPAWWSLAAGRPRGGDGPREPKPARV